MTFQLDLFTDAPEDGRSHSAPESKITPEAARAPSERAQRYRKKQVLEYLLKHGTVTCREIEDKFHRGQAPIRELRLDGHLIDTVKAKAGMSYWYRGFNERVRVNDRMKAIYYESEHWKRTAMERKSVDGNSCSQCGSRNDLETHHWRYDLFNEDILFDLQTLCVECHDRLHGRLRGSKIHFPKSITPVVARELGWAG